METEAPTSGVAGWPGCTSFATVNSSAESSSAFSVRFAVGTMSRSPIHPDQDEPPLSSNTLP